MTAVPPIPEPQAAPLTPFMARVGSLAPLYVLSQPDVFPLPDTPLSVRLSELWWQGRLFASAEDHARSHHLVALDPVAALALQGLASQEQPLTSLIAVVVTSEQDPEWWPALSAVGVHVRTL